MFSFIFLNNISNKYANKIIENDRNESVCNKVLRIWKVPNQTPTYTFHIKVSLGCHCAYLAIHYAVKIFLPYISVILVNFSIVNSQWHLNIRNKGMHLSLSIRRYCWETCKILACVAYHCVWSIREVILCKQIMLGVGQWIAGS